MYSVRWPWASRSISNTRWPCSASAAPRLTAVVVFPTPPFCIATAIVRAKSDWESNPCLAGPLRSLEWRPRDHRHCCRPADPDRDLSWLPARRDPALDGRDLFFRHAAGHLQVPRPVHGRDAEDPPPQRGRQRVRSEEHTSELQSQSNIVCRLLL